MKNDHPVPRSRRFLTVFLASLAVLLAVTAALCAWAWLAPAEQAGTTISTASGKTREQIQAELDQAVQDSMMTVMVSPTAQLAEGDHLEFYVVNSPDNSMPQSFSIEQDGATLYESQSIAPGMQTEGCTAPGITPGKATVVVRGLDPSSGQAQGNAAAVEITVVEKQETE